MNVKARLKKSVMGKKEKRGGDVLKVKTIPDLGKTAATIFRLSKRTLQHSFDRGTDESRVAEDDKLKAVARDQRDVLAVVYVVCVVAVVEVHFFCLFGAGRFRRQRERRSRRRIEKAKK